MARGADPAGLLALISSAYANGENNVLDRLHERMSAESKKPGPISWLPAEDLDLKNTRQPAFYDLQITLVSGPRNQHRLR